MLPNQVGQQYKNAPLSLQSNNLPQKQNEEVINLLEQVQVNQTVQNDQFLALLKENTQQKGEISILQKKNKEQDIKLKSLESELQRINKTTSSLQEQLQQLTAQLAHFQQVFMQASNNNNYAIVASEVPIKALVKITANLELIREKIPDLTSLEQQNFSIACSAYRDALLTEYTKLLNETAFDLSYLNNLSIAEIQLELRPLLQAVNTFHLGMDIVQALKKNTLLKHFNILRGQFHLKSAFENFMREKLFDWILPYIEQPESIDNVVPDMDVALCDALSALSQHDAIISNETTLAMIETINHGLQETHKKNLIYQQAKFLEENCSEIVKNSGLNSAHLLQSFSPAMISNKGDIMIDFTRLADGIADQAAMSIVYNMDKINSMDLAYGDMFKTVMETILWQLLIKLTNISSGLANLYHNNAINVSKSVASLVADCVPLGSIIPLILDIGLAVDNERKKNHAEAVLFKIGINNFVQHILTNLPQLLLDLWQEQINQLARKSESALLKKENNFFPKLGGIINKGKNAILNEQIYPLHVKLALFMGALISAYFSEIDSNLNMRKFSPNELMQDIVLYMRNSKNTVVDKLKKNFGFGAIRMQDNNPGNNNNTLWYIDEVITEPVVITNVNAINPGKYGTLNIKNDELKAILGQPLQSSGRIKAL